MAREKIRGKIIRILDTRTVIINLGEVDDIDTNSVFYILGDPEPVVDPDTKEELGLVNVIKSKIKASQVFDRFTVATTKWTQPSPASLFAFKGYYNFLGGQAEVIDEGELRVKPEELQPWKAQSEIPVMLGDIVEVDVEKPATDTQKEASVSKREDNKQSPGDPQASEKPSKSS